MIKKEVELICSCCGKKIPAIYREDGSVVFCEDDACHCSDKEQNLYPADNGISISDWAELVQVAKDASKKICNPSCISCFDCGHNKACMSNCMPKVSSMKDCPLEKFNAYQAEIKPWYKQNRSDREITEYELFAICACCENSVVTVDDDLQEYNLERKDFLLCCDCPVKSVEDSMAEISAEAFCS